MKLLVEIDREQDGRWIADVPEIAGVSVYGDTRSAAMTNARALALRAIADCLEHDESLPVPLDDWFRSSDEEDVAIGRAQLALAGQVLEDDDFSDWPDYPGDDEVRP